MKCPQCGYSHGIDVAKKLDDKGKYGSFFTSHPQNSTIKMVKGNWEEGFGKETAQIFGCPSCKNIFMVIER